MLSRLRFLNSYGNYTLLICLYLKGFVGIMFAFNVLGSQSQHCQVIFMFCVENIYFRARDFVISQQSQ